MSKVPIHHPSSIWDWYKEGKRHSCGSVAFVAWPDHVASLADKDKRIAELEKALREAHSAMVKVEKFGYGVNIEKDLVITNTQDLMIKAANGLAEALKEKG